MRIDSTLSLLFLSVVLAATPVISQVNPDSGVRDSHPTIRSIEVAESTDSVEVEVEFSKLVQPDVHRLEQPDRLVFDFPGCELGHPGQHLVVNRGSVLGVRASEFSVVPPIARVVIDLKSPQDHEEAYVGNKLVIKLHLTGGDKRLAPASGGITPAADIQPLVPQSEGGSERAAPKPSDDALPRPSAQQPSGGARTATAYALLAKARALAFSDLEPLEAKAKAGGPEAETILGLAYHAGTLLKMDDAEALVLLRRAANRGFVAAEEVMGIFCQSGFGMAPDKAQAVSWYTKAAQHGSREA